MNYLVYGENASELIRYFEESFDASFEIKTEKDPDIQKIEDILIIIKRQRALKKYLEYVNDVEKIIDAFVKADSLDSRYLFIGAPFGTGKTTLVKKVASKYADEYLKAKRYIPIFVLLKDGLERVYNDLNINEVFDRIIAPDNNSNEKAFNRNILLLLDGLDEYHDNDADQEKNLSDNSKDIKMLMEKIENDFTKYRNLKVIITARLQHDLPSKLPMVMGKERIKVITFYRTTGRRIL